MTISSEQVWQAVQPRLCDYQKAGGSLDAVAEFTKSEPKTVLSWLSGGRANGDRVIIDEMRRQRRLLLEQRAGAARLRLPLRVVHRVAHRTDDRRAAQIVESRTAAVTGTLRTPLGLCQRPYPPSRAAPAERLANCHVCFRAVKSKNAVPRR